MELVDKIKAIILDRSIKTNLLRLYITIIVVMSSILVIFLFYIITLQNVYNKNISNFRNYNNIYNNMESIDRDIYFNISEQKPFNDEYYSKLIKNTMDSLNQIKISPKETDIFIGVNVLKRTIKTMSRYIDETGLLIKNNSNYDDRENKLTLIIEAKTIIKNNIQQLIALDFSTSEKHVKLIATFYNIILSLLVALVIISIFVCIAFLHLVIETIEQKINTVSDNANKLANGDLAATQIIFNPTDEFYILAQSFNKMKENIKEYINKLSFSEMKTSRILNEMNDCIITTNLDGEIDSCNYAIEKIFKYAKDEVIRRNIIELIPEIDYSTYGTDKNLILGAKVLDSKYQIKGVRKDGTIFPIELNYYEIEIEGYKVINFVIHDTTQHQEIERLKNEFISTVSHELRTPLTSIIGSLGLILSEVLGSLNPKTKELLHIANNNSVRLLNLINDILDLEKIKAGKMEFSTKEYDVLQLIKEAIQLNEEYAKQYNVKYDLIEEIDEAIINVDKNRFIQIITNLLSNAAKFSFANETVKIIVKREKQSILISVINKGVGIKEKDFSLIFESFSQVDSSDSRKRGGTGLGLSITKSLLKKMSGNINFTSTPNDETNFYIELPEIIK